MLLVWTLYLTGFLTMSGRVLVRLGGGGKKNRLCENDTKKVNLNIQNTMHADKKNVLLLGHYCQLW